SPHRHEIDDLRRHLLRRDREVAFVFPVFVVHHHHDAPGADLLDGVWYRYERHNSLYPQYLICALGMPLAPVGGLRWSQDRRCPTWRVSSRRCPPWTRSE